MKPRETLSQAKQKIATGWSAIPEPIRKSILPIIGVGLLGVVEWPYAEKNLLKLVDLISLGLLATPTWEIPVKHGISEIFTNQEVFREFARYLAIDISIGFVAGFLYKGFDKVNKLLIDRRSERILLGIEPLQESEVPSHVYIGPAQIASDLARAEVESKKVTHDEKHPVVVVHVDDFVPPRLGQEIDRHFKAGNPEEILDIFPPSKEKTSFIEASGIDRAQELTFICINPENAIFYGYTADSQMPPVFVSSLIKKIVAEDSSKLKGKRINVIMPQVTEIAGTSRIEEELQALEKEYGFTLNFIESEKLSIDVLSLRLGEIEIMRQKTDNKPFNLVLLGQGGEDKDLLMLDRFGKALSQVALNGKKIDVKVIKRDAEEGQDDKTVRSQLDEADFIICYGDQDIGTTSLVSLLEEHFHVDRSKIGAVIERISRLYEVDLDSQNIFSIYQIILNEFSSTS